MARTESTRHRPRAPASSAGGRSRARAIAAHRRGPQAHRRARRNVNDATPPPATPAPFDVLDSDVPTDRRTGARRPDARPRRTRAVSAAAGPPRRAAEEGAAASSSATASLESRVASMRLTTEAPNTEEDSLAAAEAGRCKNGSVATSAPIDPAEFATLGMDSPTTTAAGSPVGSDAPPRPGTQRSAKVESASLELFPRVVGHRWVLHEQVRAGRVLSDGTFGVVFNDATKMTQSALDDGRDDVSSPDHGHAVDTRRPRVPDVRGDVLEYRERARRQPGAASTERRVAPPRCASARRRRARLGWRRR